MIIADASRDTEDRDTKIQKRPRYISLPAANSPPFSPGNYRNFGV